MGYLVYNDRAQYRFDDRTLSHLKIAITSKLRLQEGFLLSWRVAPEDGGGRISIWLSPSIQLQFLFNEATPPPLNPQWLEALARSSHGLRGMVVMTEDDAELVGSGPATDPEVQQRIKTVLDDVSARRFPHARCRRLSRPLQQTLRHSARRRPYQRARLSVSKWTTSSRLPSSCWLLWMPASSSSPSPR